MPPILFGKTLLIRKYESENMETSPDIRGFTLVELLVSVTVLSILLVVGVPAFQSFIQNNRQTSQLNTVVMTLLSARSEAIRSNTPVVVCTSTDGKQCRNCGSDTECGNWEDGWMVFTDVVRTDPATERNRVNDAGGGSEVSLCETTNDDCVLSAMSTLPAGTTLRFDDGGDGNAITYLPVGGSNPTGVFTLCVPHASKYKEIAVTSTGRPMTSESDPAGGKTTVESCP